MSSDQASCSGDLNLGGSHSLKLRLIFDFCSVTFLRDAVRPNDSRPSLLERHGHLFARLQGTIKRRDQGMQAIVLDDFLGGKTSDVRGNLRTDAEPLGHCLQSACRRFRKGELRGMSDPHSEEVRADYAFRPLNNEPVLQRSYIPRNLDVGGTALALRRHAPLVKQEVAVTSACAIERFHILNFAQERFGEV